MKHAEVSAFVARLESGRIAPEEFKALNASDWDAVRSFLEARRQDHLQQYVNRLYLLRMTTDPHQVRTSRTYSEEEILAELATHD